MTDAIDECVREIVDIADGSGDEAWRRSQAQGCIESFVRGRPQAVNDLKDALTIAAGKAETSQLAKRLLADMRAHVQAVR